MSAKISCDHCERDLTGGSAMPGYRLTIAPERIPTGDHEYAVMVHPPMPLQRHHFCGWPCLDQWRADQARDSHAYRIFDKNT